MATTIPISFKVIQFQPDQREYKVTMPLIQPADELLIVVDVPIEYLYNAEDILQQQIAGNKTSQPLLEIAGWNWIEEQFLARSQAKVEQKSNDDNIVWEGED